MGMLTADLDSDLLDPLSWKKERYPVLQTNNELEIYGPGHNSFTVDEDGNPIMVYHARKEAEIEGNPLYNPNSILTPGIFRMTIHVITPSAKSAAAMSGSSASGMPPKSFPAAANSTTL